MDPLIALPAEIALRILDFAPVSSIACLTRLNHAWHDFIEELHQDAIYSSTSKTGHPAGAKDFSFLSETESFGGYFDNVTSWRDLCKRQTLLKRNYNSARPKITDNFIVPLSDSNRVWRFRTDLKRRFFICTSQDGGLQVTDVDGKGLLWHLPADEVPPFAHLEYEDGMTVWSTLGDALEVWRTDEPGLPRGQFRKMASLDCPMHHLRGFHLAFKTLCVVGDDGSGLVYDMRPEPPKLHRRLEIREGAVGHLCQGENIVMYSMGSDGYHIHDKSSGEFLGALHPDACTKIHHIVHPVEPDIDEPSAYSGDIPSLPSHKLHSEESSDTLAPINVQNGPLPFDPTEQDLRTPLDEDVWGAGLLDGNLAVGISRGGRVFICSNWREALKSDSHFAANTAIIECEDNEENFLLGGWLSIRDNRVLFEIQDKVYLVSLTPDGRVQLPEQQEGKRPSWCFFSALNPGMQRRLQSGNSMMALFDDCVMTTCGICRSPAQLRQERREFGAVRVPTKGIRVLCLAPKME